MSANVQITNNYKWSNEHNNVHQDTLRRYQIHNNNATKWRDGLEGILQMVGEARSRREQLRSYGGKWSLSDVAICSDSIHDSKPLTYWASIPQRFVSGDPVYDDPKPLHERLLFFQSGAQISQINRALEERGLCLSTTGASNGQTIAGAVSTGTHGSALKIGAMQDYVRALHIVTDGNKHVILQPSDGSGAATSQGFKAAFNQDLADLFEAELVSDDDQFYAALVSFGAFGVIHGMFLEAVSLYALEAHNKLVDYTNTDSAFTALSSFDHDSNHQPHLLSRRDRYAGFRRPLSL